MHCERQLAPQRGDVDVSFEPPNFRNERFVAVFELRECAPIRGEQAFEIAARVTHESEVVDDVLHRRIDLVRDSRRELTYCLELLREPELAFHACAHIGLVTQTLVRRLQIARPRVDERFEVAQLERGLARELPAALQGVRELPDLDRVERLLEDQHAVRFAERGAHVFPAVVGVCRADHDAQVRVRAQQLARCLDAVPTRRHPHVDERERVGAVSGERCDDLAERFLALERGVELEAGAAFAGRRGVPEDLGTERRELVVRCTLRPEDPPEVLVDVRVVVDQEYPAVGRDGGVERAGAVHSHLPEAADLRRHPNHVPLPSPGPPRPYGAVRPACGFP